MVREVIASYGRAHALIYLVITSAFALLFLYITLRFARGGDVVETLMLAGLTVLLLGQVRRWYRRVRGAREERAASGADAPTA